MATRRLAMKERREIPDLTPALRAWLESGTKPQRAEDVWEWLRWTEKPLDGEPSRGETLWRQFRDYLVEEWIADSPGTRPWGWWEWDAPEPRQQVSGAGKPAWIDFALVPCLEQGVPLSWDGYSAENPPAFESEATYLKRRDLLSAAEARRLKAADFEPQVFDFSDSDYAWVREYANTAPRAARCTTETQS